MGTSPQINPGLQRTANTEFLKDAGLRNGHSIYPEWSEPSQQHAQVEYLRPQVINLFQISNSLPLWSLPQYSAKRALEPPPTFIGHSFSALALQHFKPDHFFFLWGARSNPQLWQPKMYPNIAKYSLGRQISPAENQWYRSLWCPSFKEATQQYIRMSSKCPTWVIKSWKTVVPLTIPTILVYVLPNNFWDTASSHKSVPNSWEVWWTLEL